MGDGSDNPERISLRSSNRDGSSVAIRVCSFLLNSYLLLSRLCDNLSFSEPHRMSNRFRCTVLTLVPTLGR